MNKLESLILELEDEITKAKKVFGVTMVNKDRLLSLTDSIRDELPEVVSESKHVLKNKEYILQEAIDLSLKRTQQAQETADYLVSTSEITLRAEAEAKLIMQEAARQAHELIQDSKRRIDKLLSAIEQSLLNHLTLVRNNREELKGELLRQFVPLSDEEMLEKVRI